MGLLSPRPPLPASATPAELRADLDKYRRENMRTIWRLTAAIGAGLIAGVAILAMVTFL